MFRHDFSGVKEVVMGKGFDPLPEGKYQVEIIDYKETTSKKGDPLVKVTYEVLDSEYSGRKLFDQITFLRQGEKGAGIALHFLHIIDEPHEPKKLDINPNDWLHKRLQVEVVIDEKYNNNKIVSREIYEDVPF